VAQRIQQGLQLVTDMTPADRESYATAKKLLAESGTRIPLVAAIEDYLRARAIAGTESLASMAADHARYFKKIVRKVSVPEVVTHLLESKEQDGTGKRHLNQLRWMLNRFAAAFPGPILDVTSADVDTWLRGLGVSQSSRNSMLRYLSILFSFAQTSNYLPDDRPTATSGIKKAKVVSNDATVFTPDQLTAILHAAPQHLIPTLAIGAFSGIRMAELARLDWSAVNLDRKIIEVRAGQAKTASRRVIPISDNLAAWLAPLPRVGKVITGNENYREITALARAVGFEWPRNVLRHSFISYRIATVQSAEQVALEAGNSPSIIFKHYRELVTEDAAAAWFSILPKPDQMQNRTAWSRKKKVAEILPPA
jgi:integrase